MTGTMPRRLVAALALVAVLAATGCGRGAAGEEESDEGPLKVALITDSSGAVALFGEANVNGAKLAVEELNAAGGVDGRKVELLVRDSKATPETGVQLTRDAILRDKVDALLGPVSSGVAVAMTDVAEQYKTPIFFHTSNSDALTGASFHKYAFSVVPSTTMEGRGNAVALADSPHKRWAVIGPDYEFGHVQTEAFMEKLSELKPDAEFVKKVYPALGEKDFGSFIATLKSANADAVYGALFAGDLIAFTKQARPLGFFEDQFFTSLYEKDALKALGDEAPEGVRAYSRAPFFALDNEAAKAFVEKYRSTYDDYPSDWAIMAYDAVKLWARGVEKAGSAEPYKLVAALEGAEFESLRGSVAIRPVDHQASVPVFYGTITQDSEFGFPAWKDVKSLPAEEVWLSEDEAKAAQQGG